jgi:hypothetical protein
MSIHAILIKDFSVVLTKQGGVMSSDTIFMIRFVSTGLLVLSAIQFLVIVLIMRPGRFKAVRLDTDNQKVVPLRQKGKEGNWFVWRDDAGHTKEQRFLQVTILESVIGTILLVVTKLG